MEGSTGNFLAGMAVQDVVKVVAVMVAFLGSGVQLWQTVVKDLRSLNYAHAAIGSLGNGFLVICRAPLLLGQVFLLGVVSVGVLALFGGANHATGLKLQGIVWSVCGYIYDQSLWIVGLYFAGAFALYFKAVERLFLLMALFVRRFLCRRKSSLALINADWFLQRGEASGLINISDTGCDIVGSFLLHLPGDLGRSDYAGDAFLDPRWNAANRANAMLVCCVIEGIIHDLPSDAPLKAIALSQLYNRLGSDEALALWDPSSLSTDGENLRRIRDFLRLERESGLHALLEEPAVRIAVERTIEILSKKWRGDASALAYGAVSQTPSLERIKRRLRDFPKMREAEPNVMDALFIKLAVSKNVWFMKKPGQFPYQFSRGVGLFMMNTGCLLCTTEIKAIVMDDLFRRLLASAEERIVNSVNRVLKRDSGLVERLHLGQQYTYWDLCRQVDYLLWWLGRQPRGWELNLEALQNETVRQNAPKKPRWKLDWNSLVRN